MVVDTRKFSHTTSYRPQIMCEEYLKSRFHLHLKTASYLPVGIKSKADFIVRGATVGTFKVKELKKRTEPINIRRYMEMPILSRGSSVENRIERLEKQFNKLVSSTWSYLFNKRNVEEMAELSKGMLADSKRMQELAEQLEEADDER